MQSPARIESPTRRRTLHWIAVLAVAIGGCVSVDYVGKSFPPTTQVDVYLSMTDVKRPYTTIGEVRADTAAIPLADSAQDLQEKMIAEARKRGANGIVLGGLDRRRVVGPTSQTVGTEQKGKSKKSKKGYASTTTGVDEVVELRGTLIRYTD
jgi:hypothetical protein